MRGSFDAVGMGVRVAAVLVASLSGCLSSEESVSPGESPGGSPAPEVLQPSDAGANTSGLPPAPTPIAGTSRVRVIGACDGTQCIGVTSRTSGTFEVDRRSEGTIVVEWTPSSEFTRKLRVTVPGGEATGTSPLSVPVAVKNAGSYVVQISPASPGAMIDQEATWRGTLS